MARERQPFLDQLNFNKRLTQHTAPITRYSVCKSHHLPHSDGYSPIRDLISGGVVLELYPRRVVLGDKAVGLPIVDVAVVEQLVDDLAVLHQHVLRGNLSGGP